MRDDARLDGFVLHRRGAHHWCAHHARLRAHHWRAHHWRAHHGRAHHGRAHHRRGHHARLRVHGWLLHRHAGLLRLRRLLRPAVTHLTTLLLPVLHNYDAEENEEGRNDDTKDNADDLLAAAPHVQDNMKNSKAQWKKVCKALTEAGR